MYLTIGSALGLAALSATVLGLVALGCTLAAATLFWVIGGPAQRRSADLFVPPLHNDNFIPAARPEPRTLRLVHAA